MTMDKEKQWLKNQYQNKEADPSEIGEWILENGDSPEFDDIMMDLLESTENFDPASSSRGYSLFKTRLNEHKKTCRKVTAGKILRYMEHVAAALLIPVALWAFNREDVATDVEWLEANTSAGQTMDVSLADGSVMTLGPSTKLVYPSAFPGDERKVFLIGSVYADVETDENKPFIVSAGNLEVNVLGTEFHMTSYNEDSEAEIALVDGSVKLHNKSNNIDVSMRPGEIVSFDKSTGAFVRKNVAAGYYKDIIDGGGFQFVNQRLGDIASCLERHFSVTILIDDADIANERYFASFINNEDVDEILKVLNAQNFMKIVRNGNIIHISHNN